MQQSMHHVLSNYLIAKQEDFGNNDLANFIRNTLEARTVESCNISLKKYKVEGSPGKGNWAEVPWLCVFDKDITQTATRGFYIVYLFNADMSGVHLSLNQGWTHYKEKYKAAKGKEYIKKVANSCKHILRSSLNDFSFNDITLHCSGNLGKGYEYGHICGKYYSKENIPNKLELVNDLRNLLGVYRGVIWPAGM